MPQHEHMERHFKLHGRRMDAPERERKKEARLAQKATMRKTIAQHRERSNQHSNDEAVAEGALPAYLLDREGVSRAKVLSNTIKQKRKEKAGKWEVPIPKVKPVADDEMFKVMRTGTKKQKAWKRVVTKCTFVGQNFTRKNPKYERFIRPSVCA
jgi:ribosome biogenesis protein NSA2